MLGDPTGSMVQVRGKGEKGLVLSRAEWTTLAHFVQCGVEAYSPRSPQIVSKQSLIAVMDAFVAVYALRTCRQCAPRHRVPGKSALRNSVRPRPSQAPDDRESPRRCARRLPGLAGT